MPTCTFSQCEWNGSLHGSLQQELFLLCTVTNLSTVLYMYLSIHSSFLFMKFHSLPSRYTVILVGMRKHEVLDVSILLVSEWVFDLEIIYSGLQIKLLNQYTDEVFPSFYGKWVRQRERETLQHGIDQVASVELLIDTSSCVYVTVHWCWCA